VTNVLDLYDKQGSFTTGVEFVTKKRIQPKYAYVT